MGHGPSRASTYSSASWASRWAGWGLTDAAADANARVAIETAPKA